MARIDAMLVDALRAVRIGETLEDDGGPCDVGVESTVVDFVADETETVRILRPGGITEEMLIDGAARSTMDALGDRTLAADKVLVF